MTELTKQWMQKTYAGKAPFHKLATRKDVAMDISEPTEVTVKRPNVIPLAQKIELVLVEGDLSKLSPEERVSYYNKTCQSLGLNPLTKPFDYIRLNNKLVLYAKKDATDQLRKIYGVSIQIVSRELIGDVYVVTARAKMPDGREDESTGAVALGKAVGDVLANQYMKAETKAKRRVTLSICGLGMLDETEVESIPQAAVVEPAQIKPASEETFPFEQASPASSDPADYVVPFGKYAGKKLSEVGADALISYCNWIQEKASNEGKEIAGKVKELFDRVENFVKGEEELDIR